MKNSEDIRETALIIRKDFNLEEEALDDGASSLEELKKQLTSIINYLLDKDFQRLLNSLYRIDVSENRVKDVLSNESPDAIAPGIAELIIERELKKAETRKKYKSF
ncbi:MAG: hypothetical protein AAFX87_13745 [Bacteroidota bacterium]